jgi:hypothetical protein
MNPIYIFLVSFSILVLSLILDNKHNPTTEVIHGETPVHSVGSNSLIKMAPPTNAPEKTTPTFNSIDIRVKSTQGGVEYNFDGKEPVYLKDNSDLHITYNSTLSRLEIINQAHDDIIVTSLSYHDNECTETYKDGGRLIEPNKTVTFDTTFCANGRNTDIYIRTKDAIYIWTWEI